ncbi:MAG: triose-phosphate isomerase [Micavibrio aeruginosavorus]|nr:triose-phosphate isomerase [Micavibrio aeruginosavorus]
MQKKLIAGNWKMNGDLASALALTRGIVEGVNADPGLLQRCDVLICPPFVHLARVRANLGQPPLVMLGAQDCSERENGAVTGDISAAMLADCGCGAVILGHSERRQFHQESDALIAAKAGKAHAAGLIAVICVGESESQRAAGTHFEVVAAQLKGALPASMTPENTVIAYEPVWAIGTGKTATPEDVREMHAFIRKSAGSARILYGGSVKPENAAELFKTENVDGALIGGASLKAEQYLSIAKAA